MPLQLTGGQRRHKVRHAERVTAIPDLQAGRESRHAPASTCQAGRPVAINSRARTGIDRHQRLPGHPPGLPLDLRVERSAPFVQVARCLQAAPRTAVGHDQQRHRAPPPRASRRGRRTPAALRPRAPSAAAAPRRIRPGRAAWRPGPAAAARAQRRRSRCPAGTPGAYARRSSLAVSSQSRVSAPTPTTAISVGRARDQGRDRLTARLAQLGRHRVEPGELAGKQRRRRAQGGSGDHGSGQSPDRPGWRPVPRDRRHHVDHLARLGRPDAPGRSGRRATRRPTWPPACRPAAARAAGSSVSPTKSLFDSDTSTGQPVAVISRSRLVTSSECQVFLPKSCAASMIDRGRRARQPRPRAAPAAAPARARPPSRRCRRPGTAVSAAAAGRRARRPARRRTRPRPPRAVRPQPPQLSLIRSAPAAQAARPTSCRQVSTLITMSGIGGPDRRDETGGAPDLLGRVDLGAGRGGDAADVDDVRPLARSPGAPGPGRRTHPRSRPDGRMSRASGSRCP